MAKINNVKREKLKGSERVKHDIYHIIRDEIVRSRNILELQKRLKDSGVDITIKFRRKSNEPQGVSFTKDNCTFKGSQIDRNFSLVNLMAMLKVVDDEYSKVEKEQNTHDFKHRIPYKLGGIKLSEEQRLDLDNGNVIY